MKLKAFISVIAATVALGVAQLGSAAIPQFAAVEGALMASGGAPAADGNYAITFGIFKEEVGGNALWLEGPVNVGVKGGHWTYQLGSSKPLSAAILNGANLWLSLQVASDPELPRRQLSTTAFAVRAGVADGIDCSGCIGPTAIDPKVFAGLAKTSDLSPVATSGEFKDLKGGPDLSAYAKTAALAAVATSGNYGDIKNAPDLNAYAKVSALAAVAQSGSYKDIKDGPVLPDVAKTGAYGDLLNKPVLPQLGKSCGTNLVMTGIKADGSYECATSAIAPDMIDEISNGLIWNQFVDSTPGTKDVLILDGNGAGKSDSLIFPDIGSAQAIWVEVDVLNSDVSSLTIELYGPGMSAPYILYSKSGKGQTIKTSFNKDTPLASGDMNKDWIGKNPKGTWSLTVKDPLQNQLNSPTDGKFTWALSIQTLSTKKIQIKGNLYVDGETATGGGLKFGNSATCDAAALGKLRTDPTLGVQLCQKNWNNSNAVDGYIWAQMRNTPIVWSGGCTSQSQGADWAQYCADGTDFNSAGDYLTVATNGTFTVKISGYYRLNFWADQHGCGHKRLVTRINGTDRAYAHHGNTDHRWNANFNDFQWPLRKGDVVTFWAHHDGGCNPYRWHSWNASGQHSRLQVEYSGPLQEGYKIP